MKTSYFNKFYMGYPCSVEEQAEILEYLQFERECDEENALMFAQMDKSHLNKTKLKQAESATRRWTKDSTRNIRNVTNIRVHSMNIQRNWYHNS